MSPPPAPTPPAHNCPRCGYSLAALPDQGRCPECGEPYDPVTFLYLGDPTLAKRNRHAWAAVLLPVLFGGVSGALMGGAGPPKRLAYWVVICAAVTLPLAGTIRSMAPFHPGPRLMGASVAGVAFMGLAYALGRMSFDGAGRAASLEQQALATVAGVLFAPVVAKVYALVGKRCSR